MVTGGDDFLIPGMGLCKWCSLLCSSPAGEEDAQVSALFQFSPVLNFIPLLAKLDLSVDQWKEKSCWINIYLRL